MMRRPRILMIAALAAIALAAAACGNTANNSNSTNTTGNTSNSTAANTTTTTTTTNNSNATNTSTATGGSPTQTFRALYEAFKSKDVPALKKTMASSDIKDIEEAGKQQGKSVDDFLKSLVEDPSSAPPPTLETRNEVINGDKATLEVKDKTGDWDKISFVKEGGEWKVLLKGGEAESK